jgi:Peptidase family M1 domain/Carboxypeptidase regulatory-like domain
MYIGPDSEFLYALHSSFPFNCPADGKSAMPPFVGRVSRRQICPPRLLQPVVKLAFVMCVLCVPSVYADVISGTVYDPSGAVIAGARIEITGGALTQPIALSSDAVGNFQSPDLKPGKYSLRVMHDGFETLVRQFDVPTQPLELTLSIAAAKVNVTVPGQAKAFANSDPIYRQLREIGLGNAFTVENFKLQEDVGTFEFHKGTLTFLNPVNGFMTGAIFVGEGHFNLKPFTTIDKDELKRRTGDEEANEDFTEVVFRFTHGQHLKFMAGARDPAPVPPEAGTAFDQWKEKVRKRHEIPLALTEALLHGEYMDNVDADVTAAVYNPAHPEFVNAYIRGEKHKDLRFFMRARVGALPQMDSPEEVGLLNYSPEGMEDGIWYLQHLKPEFANHTASSGEERRLFATHNYKIETVIAKNQHLFSSAQVTLEPLIAGERVLKFGLLPNLRVSRVSDDQGKDLYFIQESRKEDGSFYVILADAPPVGKEFSITIEYSGDKVLEQAGEGSFYVRARSSWYPNLNGFDERALYDLTYKVPRKYKVVSVGKLESQSTEQDYAVTHWITPVPVAVAGFNYGDYKQVDLSDDITHFKISGFYLSQLPDTLRSAPALASLAPGGMTKYALEQTRAQLQLCTSYFGKIPYDEIHITEQPDFNFGQSWPNLVYLPISAYTDSTQRWMLFGNINASFTGFVQEVTPHEVAHQWWGHAVGWASYHDQWLSEGFAEFSAGLFLQNAVAGDWRKDYIDFWERLRKRILEKNRFGIAPNDAGPLWMGLRLNSPRTEDAYQNVTYPKGAYVLLMLRSMMWDAEDHDKKFIAMMQDFVASHKNVPASTESFKMIAERHMKKAMDLQGNGRLDWFFNEWVYGTQIPKYQLDYQVSPADGGKFKLHMTITQSEVDNRFGMLVPLYADFGKGMIHLGQVRMIGSSSQTTDLMLPAQPKKVMLNAYKDVLER